MTYIEHAPNCNIFKHTFAKELGCDCYARFARSPAIMGPHEKHCPYLTQMPVMGASGKMPEPLPIHGICYCSAAPQHDATCEGPACWDRRKGVVRVPLDQGVLIMPAGLLLPGKKSVDRVA